MKTLEFKFRVHQYTLTLTAKEIKGGFVVGVSEYPGNKEEVEERFVETVRDVIDFVEGYKVKVFEMLRGWTPRRTNGK